MGTRQLSLTRAIHWLDTYGERGEGGEGRISDQQVKVQPPPTHTSTYAHTHTWYPFKSIWLVSFPDTHSPPPRPNVYKMSVMAEDQKNQELEKRIHLIFNTERSNGTVLPDRLF